MSESNDPKDPKSIAEGTLEVVSGLVEKVPIYKDALQPLAQEAGKALGTVGKTVNAALMPLRGLVWGMEKIEEFVQIKVTKKLENVPPENIQPPALEVAGPAIESLRFTGHKESLSDLYANLLVTAMDRTTARTAHPGFVEIIRNLSGDEAKILSHLVKVHVLPLIDICQKDPESQGIAVVRSIAVVSPYMSTIGHDSGCEHQDMVGTYLKNLERLGLIDIPRDQELATEGVYDRILNAPSVKKIAEEINALEKKEVEFKKYYAALSTLGTLFISACVNARDKT